MSKKIEKLFKSYRNQLIHLAKLYGVVEIKSYARSAKRLTVSQLELLLIKNRIKLPTNRSSDKAIAKQELKENAIRNAYLSFAFIGICPFNCFWWFQGLDGGMRGAACWALVKHALSTKNSDFA